MEAEKRLHFVAFTLLCALAATSASSQEDQLRTDPLDRDLSVGSGTEGAVRLVSTSDTVEAKGLLGEWHRLHPDIRVDYIHQSSLEIYEDVDSQFPKRSPLFTSVLFNHYSTNAAEGYLSA
ncbi:hypothetical protein Q2941_02565 [Bradyrhizobium sp. UFLA05-153]